MDGPTARFYRDYVASGAVMAESPRSALSRYFALAFPAGAKVLDIGAGAGRDVAQLCGQGYDAYGIEPSAAMRDCARRTHPALAPRFLDGALPLPEDMHVARFDGVVCSAVLMHVASDTVPLALASIRRVLRPGGQVLLSVPRLPAAQLAGGRDRDGRLFVNHAEADIVERMAALGLARVALDAGAVSVHAGVTWTIFLFSLGRPQADRDRACGLAPPA